MAPSRGDCTAPGTNAIPTKELSWRAAAASNILQAQKKNGRLGGRKSRRGCLNCKHRRIKCDETQPACRNCTDSNRQCSGYAAAEAQKTSKTSNTIIGVQLSQSLGLQESDKRTFDYFLSWTAPRLAGIFDKDFWCGQVLQAAQVEPGILDALLAISKLYEHPQCLQGFRTDASQGEMNLPEESVGTSALGTGRPEAYTKSLIESQAAAMLDQQHQLAVRHYNRAIGRLMDNLTSGRATLLVALLSCVLFMCVEVLRDNVFAALNLFTKGYQILNQIDPSSGHVDNELFVTLKLTMTRFGILAAMYGHPDLLDGRSMYGEMDEKSGLRSMSDARTALYVVMADSLAFHRAAIPWRRLLMSQSTLQSPTHARVPSLSDIESESISQGTASRPSSSAHPSPYTLEIDSCPLNSGLASPFELDVPDEPTHTVSLPSKDAIPDVLLQQRAHYESRLLHWYMAMQSIHNKDEEATANLMMYYHASFPLLASRLSVYESIHDDYTHHYEEMVRFAEIYYRSKATQPSFTIEPGAVPILWMVVTKCRVPSLRRRALNLMKKAPIKECMWARDSVAEFAARVIAIEEEDITPSIDFSGSRGTGSPSGYEVLPPESSRIHDLEILKDMTTGKSALRVTRYLHGSGGVRMEYVRDYPV